MTKKPNKAKQGKARREADPSLKTEWVDIKRIVPYAFNNKKHPERQIEKLMQLITEVGFRVPIEVNDKFVVVTGHGRLEAAKRLGMKKIPIFKSSDLTPDQQAKYRLLDNRLSDLAEYDRENIRHELDEFFDDDEEMKELYSDLHLDEDEPIDIKTDPPDFDDDEEKPKEKIKCPKCGHKFVPE
jgi:ParB-like chromosome segregation protein Spo0J